ncbi:hypothetical protein ABEB36_006532 [Hypothenemus hampei]|uniref:Uncharacterized protein n=1 Tax=Hypothenemus hampei TaxID=57062 RepID=A0ABD1EQU8_HYPHA
MSGTPGSEDLVATAGRSHYRSKSSAARYDVRLFLSLSRMRRPLPDRAKPTDRLSSTPTTFLLLMLLLNPIIVFVVNVVQIILIASRERCIRDFKLPMGHGPLRHDNF